jgi:alpha-tubulin suppressor-like RCC1 family protein
MRAAWLTAIGLGVALAACSANAPLGGSSGQPAGTIEAGGGRPGSPRGPVIVVAPVADAAATDGVPGRATADGGASDGAALEHGAADGGASADGRTPCPDAAGCARVPTAIALGGGGAWQACALFNDETVACWTSGTSELASETAPVRVPDVAGATAISVGGENACALLEGGTVTCWLNTAGNAYAPPGSHITTPVPVTGLDGVTALSVGEMHSCAIVAGGAVKCWGVNNYGELGDGTKNDSAAPVSVLGLVDAIAISVGEFHSCALRAAGQVVCWGDNQQGELGNATNAPTSTPVLTLGSGAARAISTSGATTCALLASGNVLCWGALFTDDMTTYAFVPTIATNVVGARAVAAGPSFACAATATKVLCWGADGQGQLGDGQPKTFGPPVVVADVDPTAPLAVAAGLSRACALHDDGRISCWGTRAYFDTGMTTLDLVPTIVSGL